MKLSIIINDLNDHAELIETIRSLHATAPDLHEIVAVDDCSDQPFEFPDEPSSRKVRLYRMKQRLGCGRSRHFAAEKATGDYLLIIDSHMRFTSDWYAEAEKRIVGRPNTIHCGTCLGLKEGHMNVEKPLAIYTGATMNLFGQDANKRGVNQVFEGVWKDHPEDDSEIACLMGACYFIPRDLFFKLGGLKALREWGTDEPYLSLKAWLAGCDIRIMTKVRIGHKFRDQSPYLVNYSSLAYNKIRGLMTCLNDQEAAYLISRMVKDQPFMEAMRLIANDREEIRAEREANQKLFVHNLHWFCKKFSLPYPLAV